ncbi:MAG TPA: dienelactone hydrolase family protein [Pyrinomonadaceae bacterium]|nr:dienelactone hydrolase family protein [Pyrinomonadaceae bacterium]
MTKKKLSENVTSDLSRRDFVALSLTAGLGAVTTSATPKELAVVETDVNVKTPDGVCDAVFIHPTKGQHPGVLIWPDSGSLRPAFRELGKRLAAEGYSVLVPNHLYRTAKAPVFPENFNPVKNPDDAAFYRRITAPFFAAGAVERDAGAYVAFIDAQKQVNKKRKMGVQGYCLGGAYVIKTAALFPDRVGAGASFHGGFLATAKPDSPHLLAPKIKARLYFAVASDDDKREPDVKDKLKEAFDAAKVRAEIEVYPNATHGWCVPDDHNVYKNKVDADRAWAKLLALYKAEL